MLLLIVKEELLFVIMVIIEFRFLVGMVYLLVNLDVRVLVMVFLSFFGELWFFGRMIF